MNVAIRIRYRGGCRLGRRPTFGALLRVATMGVALPEPYTRRERELAEYTADLIHAARVLDQLRESAELARTVASVVGLGVDVQRMAIDDVKLASSTADGCRHFALIGLRGLQR